MTHPQLDKYIDIGRKDQHWYRDCTACFIQLFGQENLHLVTQLFAATSINSSLKSNIQLFRKAYYEIKNDKPFSNYLPVMKLQLDRIRNNEPISGRKISSFALAMSGNQDAVVVDIWLLRAFNEDKKFKRELSGREQSSGASTRQYDMIELACREKAELMGLKACEVSAMIWSGCRIHHTGDRNTHYKEILTHHFTNLFGVI